MRGFKYKYGDRPLEGYTIQRAAGRGGFGEVYYALSDSGREVALKMVSGYEQIELRGVGQCMNLKSPHLVTIFDVKHNDEGIPFVIMEFVSGPSLRQLLDESPSGLGAQKTAFFLREIGKGLAFLHECGIVHRDLKPGNIFYENGYVKIGDYGLSKAMAASQHSGQTITVGTVHYMAPEISMGKYDRSIDIYAMGAMLFEMLTGQTPYLGSSPGEILMKHMTAEPDVSHIEEPFATVIKKAMHRDPAQRYQNVQELVEAVFGAEHIQQSVSCFSPDSLSMVAQRVAERVAVGGGSATPPPLPRRGSHADNLGDRLGQTADRIGHRMSEIGDRFGQIGDRIGQRMTRLGDRLAGIDPAVATPSPASADLDPLNRKQRMLLALCVMGVIAALVAFLSPHALGNEPGLSAMGAFMAILGATLGFRIAQLKIIPQIATESRGLQRLALAGFATLFLMLFSFGFMVDNLSHRTMRGTIIAILLPLLVMDWLCAVKPHRKERVAFGHAVAVGLAAFVIGLIFNGSAEFAAAILAGTSLTIQVLSPWDPTAGKRPLQQARPQNTPPAPPAPAAPAPADPAAQTMVPPALLTPPAPFVPPPLPRRTLSAGRPVSLHVRYLWLAVAPLLLASGVMLLVYAGNARMSNDEFSLSVSFGIGLLLLAILSLVKSTQATFRSWWSYLIKPLILYACVQGFLLSAILLGNVNPSNDEMMIGVFFMILSLAVIPIILFVRFGRPPTVVVPWSAPSAAVPEPTPTPTASSDPAASPAPAPYYPASAPTMIADPPLDPRPLPIRAATGVLGLIGGLLLLASMSVGLAVAVDVPGMLAAGFPDPGIARDFSRDAQQAGIDNWPQLLHTLLVVLTGSGMIIAAILLMLARRWAGAMHMFRALIGIIGCGIALTILYAGLSGHWAGATGRPMPGAVVFVINQANGAAITFAVVVFLVSIVFLFWPPRRPTLPQATA